MNRMKEEYRIYWVADLFLGILLLGFILIMGFGLTMITDGLNSMDKNGKLPTKTIQTDCFDRWNNKIIGEVCEEEVVCTKWGTMGYKCNSKAWRELP